MRYLLLIILLTPFFSAGQTILDYPVNEQLIKVWKVDSIRQYEGVYSFGMSEWESELLLAIDNENNCAQIKDNVWKNFEDQEKSGWYPRFRNLTNARIEGNNFYSEESNGEFVTYIFEEKEIKGLKLYNYPNSHDSKYEIGIYEAENKLNYVEGKYPRTKFDIMPVSFWSNFGSFELKVIRNEIFARYGYIFEKGGEMEKWFAFKSWYVPTTKNVNDLLTEIEKSNIRNIQEAEKLKNSQ